MTVRLSTGLRNHMLSDVGFSGALNNGVLNVYSGPQPLTADDIASGTLLLTFTLASGAWTAGSPTNGLQFAAPVGGVVAKSASQAWTGNGLVAGQAGYFRFVGNAADSGAASTTLSRIDGSVGNSGADLNLSNINITVGAPNTVDSFTFALPPQ